MSAKKEQKPLSKRAKARLAKMRRDPHGRVALEVARYLETAGWRVIVSGKTSIRGVEKPRLGHYEFVMEFTGVRIVKPAKPESEVR